MESAPYCNLEVLGLSHITKQKEEKNENIFLSVMKILCNTEETTNRKYWDKDMWALYPYLRALQTKVKFWMQQSSHLHRRTKEEVFSLHYASLPLPIHTDLRRSESYKTGLFDFLTKKTKKDLDLCGNLNGIVWDIKLYFRGKINGLFIYLVFGILYKKIMLLT